MLSSAWCCAGWDVVRFLPCWSFQSNPMLLKCLHNCPFLRGWLRNISPCQAPLFRMFSDMLMKWEIFFYSALALRWEQRNAHFLLYRTFLSHSSCCNIASLAPATPETSCFCHFFSTFLSALQWEIRFL